MKKTQFIELLKDIKKNIISFISLVIFIALGVALFIGFSFSGNQFLHSVNKTFIDNKTYHFEVFGKNGITDDDLTVLSEIEGVDIVEGKKESYPEFEFDGAKYQSKVISVTDSLNQIIVTEGQLPEKDDEIAVDEQIASRLNIKVGQEIKITSPSYVSNLKQSDFTVTAVVGYSANISKTLMAYGSSQPNAYPIDGFLFAHDDAFSIPIYTSALIYCGELDDYFVFSDEYEEKSAELENKISETLNDDSFYINTRIDGGSFKTAELAGTILVDLKYSISALFLVIAVFICYSNMSRLVFDQSVLLGAKKALGMTKTEIQTYYFVLASAALLFGVTFGFVLGNYIIKPLLYAITLSNFMGISSATYFSVSEFAFVVIFESVTVIAAAFIASHRILKKNCIILMSSSDNSNRKTHFIEKTGLFRKLSLLFQTMISNILAEKRRCLITFLSVSGSAALIGTSLFLNNALSGSISRQFTDYFIFDRVIYIDPASDDAKTEIIDILENKNIEYAEAMKTDGTVTYGDNTSGCTFFIPADSSFFDLVKNEDSDGNIFSDINDNCISCAFADCYDLKIGDSVDITDSAGNNYTVDVDGVFSLYTIGSIMILNKDLYGDEYSVNAFFIKSDEFTHGELTDMLDSVDGFVSLYDYRDKTLDNVQSITSSALGVVAIYLVISVVMALLVILNLLNMYISEKKKDIIVLRINGYERNAVNKYIYSDTVFISVLGIIAGNILGVVMGKFSAQTFISDQMTYSLKTSVPIFILSSVISAAVVAFIVILSMRKMKKFKLTEI